MRASKASSFPCNSQTFAAFHSEVLVSTYRAVRNTHPTVLAALWAFCFSRDSSTFCRAFPTWAGDPFTSGLSWGGAQAERSLATEYHVLVEGHPSSPPHWGCRGFHTSPRPILPTTPIVLQGLKAWQIHLEFGQTLRTLAEP